MIVVVMRSNVTYVEAGRVVTSVEVSSRVVVKVCGGAEVVYV